MARGKATLYGQRRLANFDSIAVARDTVDAVWMLRIGDSHALNCNWGSLTFFSEQLWTASSLFFA